MDSGEVSFLTGDIKLLDDVKEMWEQLNQMHLEKSVDFKNHYRSFTFADRRDSLIYQAQRGKLLVVIACHNDLKIGYCVASLVDGIGEIDSIFVKPVCRKSNVGNKLMQMSLDWLRANAAKKIIVKVALGNEQVFGFYKKYGFAPTLTELQIV